jgi:hypothetical protein
MNTKRRLEKFKPADWQRDPSNITTPNVQLWSQSGTMRGVISSETATKYVKNGTHFVMCCQAIGEIK